MLALVLKDLMIQKKNLMLALNYPIFMFFVFQSSDMRPMIYTMGTVMITYILLLNAQTMDDNLKNHIFINSLPITRGRVVLARYLAVIVFALLAFGAMAVVGFILGLLLPALAFPLPSLGSLGTAVGMSLLATSVYYPLGVLLGSSGARIMGTLVFITAFFLPGLLQQSNVPQLQRGIQWVSSLPSLGGTILGALVVGVVTFTSYLLSSYVYQKKDLAG